MLVFRYLKETIFYWAECLWERIKWEEFSQTIWQISLLPGRNRKRMFEERAVPLSRVRLSDWETVVHLVQRERHFRRRALLAIMLQWEYVEMNILRYYFENSFWSKHNTGQRVCLQKELLCFKTWRIAAGEMNSNNLKAALTKFFLQPVSHQVGILMALN